MNCYIYVRCNHFELQYCITTCINPYILTIYNGRNKTRIVLPALLSTNIEIEIHYKMFIMFSCQVTVCCVYSCIDINDVLQMVFHCCLCNIDNDCIVLHWKYFSLFGKYKQLNKPFDNSVMLNTLTTTVNIAVKWIKNISVVLMRSCELFFIVLGCVVTLFNSNQGNYQSDQSDQSKKLLACRGSTTSSWTLKSFVSWF